GAQRASRKIGASPSCAVGMRWWRDGCFDIPVGMVSMIGHVRTIWERDSHAKMASHRRRPVSLPAASMLGLVVIAVISIHAAAWAEPGRPPVDPATLPALPIAADDDTP